MRVLFVMPDLHSGGGLTRSTLDLSSALRVLDVDPSVACLSDRSTSIPSMCRDFETHGIPVTVLPEGQTARVRGLHRLMKSRRIDVIHTTTEQTSLVGRLASMGLRTAVVTSVQTTRETMPRRHRRGMAYRKLYRWTHGLTDRFHAVSLAVKSYCALEFGIPEHRITVIERGRDLGRLGAPSIARRLRARAALGIDPQTRVILNAGRHERQKDQVTLLAAFDRLASVNFDAHLLVVGREGSCTPLLSQRRELSAHSNRIHIMGHREDLPELMAAADIYACPSAWEGFGGTVIEAMALGLPVVASDIPPLREVVIEGETGLFACVGGDAAFAAALLQLLGDPEQARTLGANGRHLFMQRFTIERSAERMRDLYAELLSA